MTKKMRGMAVAVVAVVLCLSTVLAGCNGANKSKAVSREELIRPNYSKEMEAKHDAEGREHIEIPQGAKTVTVEGIEYTVLTTLTVMTRMDGNYILANNVEWGQKGTAKNPFKGRFHGNNYKIVGEKSSLSLFFAIENAVIQNIIISATGGREGKASSLVYLAKNSIIKDCIHYYQPELYLGNNRDAMEPIIGYAENCEISGIVNYADFSTKMDLIYSGGAIVGMATEGTTIKGCTNYGNVLNECYNEDSLGGIVGLVCNGVIVEDCVNYGAIIGVSCLGGIVGRVRQLENNEFFNNILDYDRSEDFLDTQIIRNCRNYGNIYLLKEKGTERVENLRGKRFLSTINTIGGIAGNASIIENCVNEGNFYGFESLGKKLYVDYLGGIAGAAKKVTNSENKGTYNIHKGRAKNVGDLVGYTIV